MVIKLTPPACIYDGERGMCEDLRIPPHPPTALSSNTAYGSTPLMPRVEWARSGGTPSGGSIWMVQALEPREEYKAARDGMKVMAVMLLLLLVVGVRAVMRMFLSKHTRTSTIVRRVRSWHDTYRLCSLFRTRMRAIAMYYCNSEPYLFEKAPQMLTVYFRKWGLGSRQSLH